jgi:hypothetical protein
MGMPCRIMCWTRWSRPWTFDKKEETYTYLTFSRKEER